MITRTCLCAMRKERNLCMAACPKVWTTSQGENCRRIQGVLIARIFIKVLQPQFLFGLQPFDAAMPVGVNF